MDSDQALSLLGRYSRWQLRTYFIYAIGFGIPFAWMNMAVVFIGRKKSFNTSAKKMGMWLLVSNVS